MFFNYVFLTNVFLRLIIIKFVKNSIFMIRIYIFLLIFPTLSYTQSFNGFALYNAQGDNTTYLIDENLNIAHTWTFIN